MAKLTLRSKHAAPETMEFLQIIDELNGHVSFGDATDGSHGANLDCEFQKHTFNATPNTEDSIAHTLGRTPVGFIVVNKDRAADVYADNEAGWTATAILLKCDVASAVITILIF